MVRLGMNVVCFTFVGAEVIVGAIFIYFFVTLKEVNIVQETAV